jgi:hypothetical protein
MQTAILKQNMFSKNGKIFFENFAVFIYISSVLCYNKNRTTQTEKGGEK